MAPYRVLRGVMRSLHYSVLLLGVLFLLSAEEGYCQERGLDPVATITTTPEQRLYDVVVTALIDDGTAILMGSLASPLPRVRTLFGLLGAASPQWRFRLLRIHSAMRATSFSLTKDGTKAVIGLRDGT